jgi:hypothetical protein
VIRTDGRTGEEAAEEVVDGGGKRVVAGVRAEVELPADGDAVHVDLDEQALVAGLHGGHPWLVACGLVVASLLA